MIPLNHWSDQMRRTLLLAVVLLAACQKPETPEQAAARMQAESDSARTAIEAANVRYARYLNGNMADSVASLFTENGMVMPPNMPAVTGRAAIGTWMAANPMPPGSSITFTVAEVAASGPIAIERGSYAFTMPAMGRTPAMNTAGKYLAHWHKVGGEWLVAADIWSDDVPQPSGGN